MPYDAEVVGVCISKLIQPDITPSEKEACVEELLLRNQ